jgi:uncharacterized RDD family membrane protein YckC
MVDIFLVLALSALPLYPVGPLLGFAYSLIADGLPLGRVPGRSFGKMLFKLRVVMVVSRNVSEPGSGGIGDTETIVRERVPASFRASIFRNAPVGVATFFAIIPIWGWLILGLVGIPLMIMEVYLMATVDNGHRLGDVMGDTEVIRG